MTMKSYHRTRDAELILKDAGPVAASAAATVDSSAKVIDVGNAYVEGVVMIDVSALEIASNDESYTIVLQGSPDSAFTASTSVELCSLHLGAAETKGTDTNQADAAAQYRLHFDNDHAGTIFRYLRVYTVVTGTVATGINYEAYAAMPNT